MKSNTRTVLSTTLTNATSYSSGPLFVGDLYELAVDCGETAFTYVSGDLYLTVSRLGADGNLYFIGSIRFDQGVGFHSADFGAGLVNSNPNTFSRVFGDQIQLDLVASSENNVSTTISVLGKG